MLKKLYNLKNHKSFRIFIYSLIALQIIYLIFIISISVFFINSKEFLFSHDFLAYYTGAEIIKEDPHKLYIESEQLKTQQELEEIKPDTFLHFIYPPIAAYFFIPFTAFNVLGGFYLWLIVNLLILYLTLIMIFKYYKDYDWWIRILILFLILTIKPTLITLGLGQVTFLLFLALLGSWYFYKKNKDFLSGLLLSLLFIKPQYLPLTILAVTFNRNLKMLSGLITGLLGLTFISFSSTGLGGILNYIYFLNDYTTRGQEFARQLTAMANIQLISVSIFGINTINAFYFYVISSSILALFVIFVWFLKIKKQDYASDLKWAILILGVLLVSPQTNPQDYFLIVLVFIFLLPKKMNDFAKLNTRIKFVIISFFPALLFLFEGPIMKVFFVFYLLFIMAILIYEIINKTEILNKTKSKYKLLN